MPPRSGAWRVTGSCGSPGQSPPCSSRGCLLTTQGGRKGFFCLQPPLPEEGLEKVGAGRGGEGASPPSLPACSPKIPLPRVQGSMPTQAQPLPPPQAPALPQKSSPPVSGQS